MTQFVYYFIIKVYKGLFVKKHRGNVHMFLIPTDKDYLFLAMLGELTYEPGKYATQSMITLSPEKVNDLIVYQKEHFGDRFVSVEKVKCISKKISEGMYKIKIGKAKHILSDMVVAYSDEFSKQIGKPAYIVQGKFDLVWEDISDESDMKSISLQKMSIIGGVEKFKNLKQDVGELKMEHDDKTFKLTCQSYLKNAIRKSKNLRSKLSFSEQKKMVDLVDKMTLREMVSAIFYKGKPITEQEEGKIKKAFKYGGAGAAGAYLGKKYLPKAIKKVAKKIPVPLIPKGRMAVGAGTAMAALYLWRRFTDKCRKGKSPKEVHLCKAAAAQAVMNDLKKGLGNCPSSHNPKKCEMKIKKAVSKWNLIYRKEREKAARPLQ